MHCMGFEDPVIDYCSVDVLKSLSATFDCMSIKIIKANVLTSVMTLVCSTHHTQHGTMM